MICDGTMARQSSAGGKIVSTVRINLLWHCERQRGVLRQIARDISCFLRPKSMACLLVSALLLAAFSRRVCTQGGKTRWARINGFSFR
jgi:hypothetical protein